MSNISYDWIVLGVAAILFAVLSFLKRKKNAKFTTRVLLATVFGIIWELLSKAIPIMSVRWVPSGPMQLPHWWFHCCCSASSPASRTLENPYA